MKLYEAVTRGLTSESGLPFSMPKKTQHLLSTHKPVSSSFLGLPCRILNINYKKELLRGLWVDSGMKGVIAGRFLVGAGSREKQCNCCPQACKDSLRIVPETVRALRV